MSRITIPATESATGEIAEVYAQAKKMAGGKLPNTFAALGHLNPGALTAVLNAEHALASSSLSHKDIQTIMLLISSHTGCDYCIAAHSFIGKMTGLPLETLRAIRTGRPTGEPKRDALVRFVSLLQNTSGTISRDEFEAIRAAGYTDTQLADISLAITLITFTNTFNRINDTDVDFPPVE